MTPLRWLGTVPAAMLFLVQLLLSVALVLPDAFNAQGFADLVQHPQFFGAVRLTLISGVMSTVLALVLALVVVAGMKTASAGRAGAFLAVPHLAFAIGLGFLIMPSGLLARILAVPAGWTAPPDWITTQDPNAFALTLALALKETPFLVWALAAVMNRDDLRQALSQQQSVAASLGHSSRSVFLRVILPQLLPRIAWPLVAVLAYGLTVVDMAFVIGPTQPPTLAQLVWTDINDADPTANARGGAGVVLLSGIVLGLVAGTVAVQRMSHPILRRYWSHHPGEPQPRFRAFAWAGGPTVPWSLLSIIYGAVFLVLAIQSFAGLWPFPNLLPQNFSLAAWTRLLSDATPVWTSLVLALVTSLLAILASVAWFETMPERQDRFLLWLSAFSLCLPALVIGLGQYRLFLLLGITGTATAMLLAHVLPVMAYVFIMLQGPYRGFDDRYRAVAHGLGAKNGSFLISVKWPLLKSALLSAFAVGFAVSIAQYVPAQLAAAGRFSTLPIEAVTLSAGGSRALTAAYGLALMALPLIVFMAAGMLGRSRWNRA